MQLFPLFQPVLGLFLVSGLLGLLVTIFMIWMIIDCLGNGGITTGMKIVWILVILVLPLIGSLLYFLLAKGGTGSRPLV